jgi:methionyl-tRNA formyltransferase
VNEAGVVEQVAKVKADAGVVIAFGQKLSVALVAAMGRLAVNLHASLLPKYRGAAPINWAIIQGEKETGVSVISLTQRMDAGVIYGQARTDIGLLETAGELHDRLAGLGPGLVQEVLERFEAGDLKGQEQDEGAASKAPKLTRADGKVDFRADATAVRRRIHGLTPWPGVVVRCGHGGGGSGGFELKLLRARICVAGGEGGMPGEVLAIGGQEGRSGLAVACGSGAIELLEVQAPGGRAMAMEDFLRGRPIGIGDRFW